MNRPPISPYGGIAGRVLRQTLSVSTMFSGIALLLACVLLGAALIKSGQGDLVSPLAQLFLGLALCHYTVLGAEGRWGGHLFSTTDEGPSRTLAIFLRYLALTAAWSAPLLLAGAKPQAMGELLGMGLFGMGGGSKGILLVGLYFMMLALAPPVLLIVSASASRFGEIFSSAHWGRILGGRIGDLSLIYMLYLGSLGFVFLLSLPLLLLAGTQNKELGLICAGLAVSYMAGLAVAVLGKLCGFFALTSGEESTAALLGPQSPLLPSEWRERAPQGGGGGDGGGAAGPLLPYLQGAPERVEEALRFAATERPKAIAMLEALHDNHELNPVVVSALCRVRLDGGETAQAVALAREAIARFLQQGQPQVAAGIAGLFAGDVGALRLNIANRLALAQPLRAKGELELAGTLYRSVLAENPTETAAVKGLLQIAEALLQRSGDPQSALAVYSYLMENCAASPLYEYMREGQAEAERRLVGN